MEIPRINDNTRKEYIMKMIDEFISKKGNDSSSSNSSTSSKPKTPNLENLFENSDLLF
jgi:hypothetical protein